LIQRSQHPADRPRTAAGAAGDESVVGLLTSTAPLPGQLAPADAERAARATLRGQIARLEGELSAILADRFPFIAAPPAFPDGPVDPSRGPRLPSLGDLERTRDALAARVQELRVRAAKRATHERRAAELLERMRLEPGRYRYYRVPVRDLGQSGCGVWEVRPRLGLIGMLAGWWELTLSSGCP
jgi:hypothetical protein